MNHYAACEIADKDGDGTGRYRYTCANKRTGVYAIGYCADNCDGHPTPEEAREHYKQYVLDNRLNLDVKLAGTQRECLVCGAWTQGLAQVDGMEMFVLCDEHRTRDEVAARYVVGEAWGSW